MNIAITSRYRTTDREHFNAWECVPYTFVQMAKKLGISLVTVPTGDAPIPVLQCCAGLIITGSSIDIDPVEYGAPSDDFLAPVYEYPDDKNLINYFNLHKMPIWGICGGMQALNVAFGGTLHKVQMHHTPTEKHGITYSDTPTCLSKLFDYRLTFVNSFHHYAVCKVAPDFKVCATSPDGVIEAIESDNGKMFGVQWHPEEMSGDQFEIFFKHFIRLCRNW